MNTGPIRITPATRPMCIQAVLSAPDGWVFSAPAQASRNVSQNALLHALFADIARQVEFFGKKRDTETVKRLLVDAFARVKAETGEPLAGHGSTLPSLDGQGMVQLGVQTRRLTKALMTELIEYLYAWGVDNGVRFTDTGTKIPGWYRGMDSSG